MSKKLVVYFSASGVTEKLAKKLSQAIDADLYEIQPEQPYTTADLDWTNKSSRSTREMTDKSFRPAITGKVENMAGKIVVPFATSGGSGMGRTNSELEISCKGAKLKEGNRFNANVKEAELKAWADQNNV